MDDEYLTDQQQAERVKHWLTRNGFYMVLGVALGLAALFGWNQWQAWQGRQSAAASMRYEALADAVRGGRLDEAVAYLEGLDQDFGGSPYVDQGRLLVAKLQLDRNDSNAAADQLRRVAQDGASAEMRQIGRLRLARLLIFQEKAPEALEVLQASVLPAFAPAVHEVRGDAYYALGKTAEARGEYEQALNTDVGATVINRLLVQAKLDDLGGATSESSGPADGAQAAAPAVPAPAPVPAD